MCGIAAQFNFTEDYSLILTRNLMHRGPDNQSLLKIGDITLIHTRLAIQDIENGSQPMVIGNHAIVFNGEIYNHNELRKRVKNHIFRTNSDTETFLALFVEYGIRCLNFCDGMFAFIIIDKKNNTCYFGRDRVGKKPLYYFHYDNKLLIASELNSIISSISNLNLNKTALEAYFRLGFFFNENTPYKNILSVKPGHVYETNTKNIKISKKRFFNLANYYSDNKGLNYFETVEKTDSILRKSISNRLLSSDLEVGVFLSGGVDSSLIAKVSKDIRNNVKTFTVGFDYGIDESDTARRTSEIIGTDHHDIKISVNIERDIERILGLYGEPFIDSSAIPSYYVSKEAKKFVSVVMNGDGADELFGGYRRYIASQNFLRNFSKYLAYFDKFLPKNKNSYLNYIHRLAKGRNKTNLDFYLSYTNDILEDVYKINNQNKVIREVGDFISKSTETIKNPVKNLMYLDSTNSLEARSPFLSKDFLEFTPQINPSYLVKGFKNKIILKDLLKKYKLTHLNNKPKRGFEVPLVDWVNNDLKSIIVDSIKETNSLHNYFDKSFVNNLIDSKINTSEFKRSKILWSMFTYSVWHKNFKARQGISHKEN